MWGSAGAFAEFLPRSEEGSSSLCLGDSQAEDHYMWDKDSCFLLAKQSEENQLFLPFREVCVLWEIWSIILANGSGNLTICNPHGPADVPHGARGGHGFIKESRSALNLTLPPQTARNFKSRLLGQTFKKGSCLEPPCSTHMNSILLPKMMELFPPSIHDTISKWMTESKFTS